MCRPATPATRSIDIDIDIDSLTAREQEILQALVTGAGNGEIGSRLGITKRTVKAHLTHIFQKLGVESRGEAVALVVRQRGVASRERDIHR